MRSKLIATTMMMAMSAVLGACDGGEDATELNAEKLSSQTGVFLNPVKRAAAWRQNFDENGNKIGFYGFWYACNSNEVMVGIHYNDGSVTCATISNGVVVQRRTVDQTGSGTKAPWNGATPQMHGCPVNSWMQGLLREGGRDEDLLCVTLVNAQNVAQGPTSQYIDFANGSSMEYGINPNMHVCKKNVANDVSKGVYGMIGIHTVNNYLACAN